MLTTASSVKAGVGKGTVLFQYTVFFPQDVQIKTGESVIWYNQSKKEQLTCVQTSNPRVL
jgi:hypothetical protein